MKIEALLVGWVIAISFIGFGAITPARYRVFGEWIKGASVRLGSWIAGEDLSKKE